MRRTYWFILFENEEAQNGQPAIVQGGRLRKAIARVRAVTKLGKGWKLAIARRVGTRYPKREGIMNCQKG